MKKGFRSITIDDKRFSWRFAGQIDIRPERQKNNRLTVDFGWFDEWLFLNDQEHRPPDFEPKTVTPEFVKQAIQFALANTWDTESPKGSMAVVYRRGQFRIASDK